MAHEIHRLKAENQPHAVPDIFGRTEHHLKHGERLQFLTIEEMEFLNKTFMDKPPRALYAEQSEWVKGFKHLSVCFVMIKAEEGGEVKRVPGVLTTFAKFSYAGELFAVVDCGEHGIVYRVPSSVTPANAEETEAFRETYQRRQGRRVVRAMRDLGASPGYEDELLLSILNRLNLYRRFMGHIEARFGMMAARSIFDGARFTHNSSELSVTSTFAVVTTKLIEQSRRSLVGERCVDLLILFGIPAGNIYQGMYEMLRETVRRTKTVMLLDRTLHLRRDAIIEGERLAKLNQEGGV